MSLSTSSANLYLLLLVKLLLHKTLSQPICVCPMGFVHMENVGKCYKLISDRLSWDDARSNCIGLEAHLAAVLNKQQDDAIGGYLKSFNFDSSGLIQCNYKPPLGVNAVNIYSSGQRRIVGDCSTSFYWKPTSSESIPFNYTNWGHVSTSTPEPNCMGVELGNESCHTFNNRTGFQWNDVNCGLTFCSLCEVDANYYK